MNTDFLNLVESFVKLAIDNTQDLQEQIYTQKKQATVNELDREKYRLALEKAADVMYDCDFISDENEKRNFLRKAAEDPIYLVRTLEKVCEAADVAQIGKPAKVASRNKEAVNDPVYQAAFGIDSSHGIVDD